MLMALVAAARSSGSTAKDTSTLYALATNVSTARHAAAFATGHTGDKLKPGDAVRTDATGHAELDWPDGSLTRLGPSTTVRISPLADPDKRKVVVRLDVGQTWNRVEKVTGTGGYQVDTPVGTAAVRGTRFVVRCTLEPACDFQVVEGVVAVTPTGGKTILVNAGQQLSVQRGATPAVAPLVTDAFIAQNEQLDALPATQRPSVFTTPAATTTTIAATTTTAHPTPAPAAPHATPSLIAFSRGGNIFTLGTDGHTHQLTTDGHDVSPSLSRDGARIAFFRGSDASYDKNLWIMNADGTGARQLATGLNYGAALAWSPGGSELAALQSLGSPVIVNTADGSTRQLTAVSAACGLCLSAEAWSPDGRSLVVLGSVNSQSGLYVVSADGSTARRLPDDGSDSDEPAWSPDGGRIVYVVSRTNTIRLVRADGSAPPQTIPTLDGACSRAGEPVWTADSRVLVAQVFCGSAPAVGTVDSATGHVTILARRDSSDPEDFVSVSGTGPFIAER